MVSYGVPHSLIQPASVNELGDGCLQDQLLHSDEDWYVAGLAY